MNGSWQDIGAPANGRSGNVAPRKGGDCEKDKNGKNGTARRGYSNRLEQLKFK